MVLGIFIFALSGTQVNVYRHVEMKYSEIPSSLCNIDDVVYPRVEFRSIAAPLHKVLHSTANPTSPQYSLNSMSLWRYCSLLLGTIEGALNYYIMLIAKLVLCGLIA